MKTKLSSNFLACFGLMIALVLSSCASPVERRISRNPETFAKLTEKDQAAVRTGRIREGMSKDAVLLSWGKPSRMAVGQKKGQSFERWTYVNYQSIVSPSYGLAGGWGWGWGGGWGGPGVGCRGIDPFWGVGMGPAVDFVPYEAAAVEFTQDKVTGWAMPLR